jgi:nucleotide-binding universal stress UspA family protein
MYKRILVATDGSTLSKKAVKTAISLAQTCGAELVALRVVPRNAVSAWDGATWISPGDIAKIEAQWAQEAQGTVDEVKQAAEAEGVRTKALVMKSNLVAETILAAAKKHKAEMVVMASHGRKGIKRIVLGSETSNVLAHADLPVLVLR